jgi:phage terminase small subunit
MAKKKQEKKAKLTHKQQRFIEEYCIDFNATQAAARAGYSIPTAAAIGCENLTKPAIKTEIDARIQILTMSANEALIKMSDFARGSFQPFLHVDKSNLITLDLTSDEAAKNIHLIKKVKQTKKVMGEDIYDLVTEIEIHDAKDAVAKVLQMHGKLVEKKQVDVTSGGLPVEATTIIFGKGSNNAEGDNSK